jgi:hypothetical protein
MSICAIGINIQSADPFYALVRFRSRISLPSLLPEHRATFAGEVKLWFARPMKSGVAGRAATGAGHTAENREATPLVAANPGALAGYKSATPWWADFGPHEFPSEIGPRARVQACRNLTCRRGDSGRDTKDPLAMRLCSSPSPCASTMPAQSQCRSRSAAHRVMPV